MIHTVGAVWRGGENDEDELLGACHRNSLELAASLGCSTIAFPAISTGAFGFPVERAAHIALREAAGAPAEISRVTFVLFEHDVHHEFVTALDEL